MTVPRIMPLLAFAVSVNGSPAGSEDTIAIIQTRLQDFDTKAEEIPPASSRYPGTGNLATDAWGPPEPLWGQLDPFSGELSKEVDWRLVAWASVGTDKDCSPSHGADLSCADAGRVCGSGDTASCCPYTDGSAMLEVTEAACKEKCAGLKQCTHVLYDANAKKCAFRENVHVGSCVTGTYTIYQKSKYQYDDANVCRKNCPTASLSDAGITDETFVGSYDFLNVMKDRCNESPKCTGFQFHDRPGDGWGSGWRPQFANVAYSGCGDAKCTVDAKWYSYFKTEVAYTIPPPAPAPVPPPAPITHAYTNCFNKNCGSAPAADVVPGEQWEWLSVDMAKRVCDKHTTCGGFMLHQTPGDGWGAGMKPQWLSSNSCSGCGSSWANNWNSYLKGDELTVAATTPANSNLPSALTMGDPVRVVKEDGKHYDCYPLSTEFGGAVEHDGLKWLKVVDISDDNRHHLTAAANDVKLSDFEINEIIGATEGDKMMWMQCDGTDAYVHGMETVDLRELQPGVQRTCSATPDGEKKQSDGRAQHYGINCWISGISVTYGTKADGSQNGCHSPTKAENDGALYAQYPGDKCIEVPPSPPSCQQTMNDYCASLNNGQCGTYARKPMGTATWTCFSSLHQTTTGLECVDDTGAQTRCAVGHVTASGCTPDLELSSIKAAAAICTQTPSPTPVPLGANQRGHADPHVVNVRGEHFDIMQEATHTFVQVPRAATAENTLLKIDAEVQRYDPTWCNGMYITRVTMTGKLLEQFGTLTFSTRTHEEDLSKVVLVRASGNNTDVDPEELFKFVPESMAKLHLGYMLWAPDARSMRTMSVKLNFDGLETTVDWVHQDFSKHKHAQRLGKINFLDFGMRGLSKLLKRFDLHEVGGLLGEDDHESVGISSSGCEKERSLRELEDDPILIPSTMFATY